MLCKPESGPIRMQDLSLHLHNESKGLDTKGGSEKIVSIGGGALRAWCAIVQAAFSEVTEIIR